MTLPPLQTPSFLRRLVPPLVPVALVVLFLAPYVFGGRSMAPLELLAVFQPWAGHARAIWDSVPRVENPLLDALQQYFPRRVYMSEALRGGWLPLWNPYVYGGSPFLATQQGAVLYPPAWLLTLFAPERQAGWSALLHLSLAALGSYLFLRRLALLPVAATAGAVAFAFNGFITVWLAYPNVTQWTLCWLPLALYCWERGRAEDDLRWIALCGMVLALNVLGGHAQSGAYVLLAWGGWAAFQACQRGQALRALRRWVLLPVALAALLSLGHLLPAMDFVPRSDRAGRVPWTAVRQASMPPAQLWTLLLPRLFGDETSAYAFQPLWLPRGENPQYPFIERSFYPGVSVLVLAAAGVLAAGPLRRRRRELSEGDARAADPDHRTLARYSLLLSAGGVLLAMGTPLYWPLWQFAPGFGQFTAVARVICISAWGLACLAALGVHALADPDAAPRGRAARAVMAAASVAALLALLGYFLYPPPAALNTLLEGRGQPNADSLLNRELLLALLWTAVPAGVAALRLPRGPGGRGVLPAATAGGLAVAAIAADLFAFGFSYNPRSDPSIIKAETPELRALRERKDPFRILSVDSTRPDGTVAQRMPSNLPSVFGLADLRGSDSFVTKRYREWEAATAKAAGGGSPWDRPGAPNLRSAGARYYLTGSSEPPRGLRAVAGALHEDPDALPYARLHSLVQALPQAELLENLALPNRVPLVALTTGPDAPVYNGPPTVTPFRVERVNGNRLRLEGEAAAPGLLVVSEAYDPGWRARVDGAAARVVAADHLLVGIPLEQGRHVVELTYAPAPYRVGLFGTLAGAAWLFALLVAGKRRRRRG